LKVIIIGGCGFIGGVLTRRLVEAGHAVTLYDIAKPRHTSAAAYVGGDVGDLATLSGAVKGQDVVVNLAAEHQDDVRPISRYDTVNVEGARVLCEALEQAGVQQLIFTSSVAVYGVHDQPIREDFSHNYFNDYGRTKHEAEDVYRRWQAKDPKRGLKIVRPTVVFGPGNRGNVYNLLKQIKSGQFLMVGNGENRKSIAYVENVAGFLQYLMTPTPGLQVFNYADKPDLTMNELVTRVQTALDRPGHTIARLPYAAGLLAGVLADGVSRLTGRKLPISAIRVKKFCMNSEIDASRCFAAGYQPPIDVWEGLDDMVRNHL
jgi:nucleoside-diphosphate-sugar epimerase